MTADAFEEWETCKYSRVVKGVIDRVLGIDLQLEYGNTIAGVSLYIVQLALGIVLMLLGFMLGGRSITYIGVLIASLAGLAVTSMFLDDLGALRLGETYFFEGEANCAAGIVLVAIGVILPAAMAVFLVKFAFFLAGFYAGYIAFTQVWLVASTEIQQKLSGSIYYVAAAAVGLVGGLVVAAKKELLFSTAFALVGSAFFSQGVIKLLVDQKLIDGENLITPTVNLSACVLVFGVYIAIRMCINRKSQTDKNLPSYFVMR
mmetsp:Transcript_16846/g.27946  ORF Transcript_16846/g.27946 Transcript_16846/m.27946 type:complete len:260 (-) Transcript_16846:560-1339(-)|eukprot:CAMPEP_0119312674 /NCGR_PEP_ID=MMETSP1333-20130426/26946_1 /TAXON_ID=418940 /ORGANISM="Scyphosphaera apsteinii, Strain RCC1455" /LENGTH=259 /DNA_ID=CAMNT_0007317327 /DNA_START=100 /DNA_END=879 /DNA_ORIENTATION=+